MNVATPHERKAGRRGRVTIHELLRRRAGWNVVDCARATSFSYSYVSKLEAGEIPSSDKYRAAVSELLGVPAALLFDENGWAV